MLETSLKKTKSVTERHLEYITSEFLFLNMRVTLTGHIFCGRHCATHFMCVIPNSHKSPMTRVLLLPLPERWGNWRIRRWADWPKEKSCLCFCSVQPPSRVQLFETPLDCSLPGFPGLLSQWFCVTISSSVVSFSYWPQSFPASGSLPMSRLFILGGQRIGASVSILPTNIPGWFPLGLTGLISLQSKGLSRVFSSTEIQKHNSSVFRLLYGSTLTSLFPFQGASIF